MAADTTREQGLVVGLVWPYAAWGGAQTHLLALARHLSSRHVVEAFVPSASPASVRSMLAAADIRVVDLPRATAPGDDAWLMRKLHRRFTDVAAGWSLVRTVRRHRPRVDVLHVDLPLWNCTGPVLALLRIAPLVQTFHTPLAPPTSGPRDRILRSKMRLVSRHSGYRVQAATAATARSLRAWIGDTVPIDVIGTVDLDAVDEADRRDRHEVREGFGIPVGRMVIGTLGQLIPRKGLDVVLDVAAELVAGGHDVHVLLGGAGSCESTLRAQADRLGLDDRLTIVSPGVAGDSHAEQIELLVALDVLTMPSHDEGLPLTLLEASALGRPAVVNDVGAISSVFTDGVDIALVRPGDGEAFRDAVERALVDPGWSSRIGRAARTRVRTDFDPRAAAAAHEAVLLHLVESGRTIGSG